MNPMQLPVKFWYYVAAGLFLIAGIYQAYKGQLENMAALFVAMAVCYGIAERGRNQWMK